MPASTLWISVWGLLLLASCQQSPPKDYSSNKDVALYRFSHAIPPSRSDISHLIFYDDSVDVFRFNTPDGKPTLSTVYYTSATGRSIPYNNAFLVFAEHDSQTLALLTVAYDAYFVREDAPE